MEDKLLKLVETFFSPQGEGYWAGTLMYFVRFPGCPVGGPEGVCTNWDGTQFPCDTGYRRDQLPLHSEKTPSYSYEHVREQKSVSELINQCQVKNVKHLLITGGEPLKHKLGPLVTECFKAGILAHVETSGTVPLNGVHFGWLTVSPKSGWLEDVVARADELKLLVTTDSVPRDLDDWQKRVKGNCELYLQPLENLQYEQNLLIALSLQVQKPQWKLSPRFHRFLKIR